ncbi:TPA: hypothetical protein N2063_002831 [Klebsiella pneumoniae]|nr:hypothetical protein [Klebsiella pneumoniae]
MKRLLIASVVVLGVCFSASAKQVILKKSAPVCLTNDELSELAGAIYREDYDSAAVILADGRCIVLSSDAKANTIEQSALRGWVKVRLFGPNGKSGIAFTTTEAIKRN